MTYLKLSLWTLGVIAIALLTTSCEESQKRVLVFSRTEGYRHESIETGIEMFRQLGAEQGFEVEATEDSSKFTDEVLSGVDAVVFLCSTGDVLDEEQEAALMRFVQAGGGFVGIHSASDTEYEWPWYGNLVGGYFASHPNDPNVRQGKLLVVDPDHPSTSMLPNPWIRTDEWYDIRDFHHEVNVLLDADETSYKRPEENPAVEPRPIAWYREFDGGRTFYTALGHTTESYTEPLFIEHIRGGLQWSFGDGTPLDYDRAGLKPQEIRFTREVLDFNLNEPMELDFLDDHRIIFVERSGAVKVHDLETSSTDSIHTFDVFSGNEEGLLGVAVDPNYADNGWVYFSMSHPTESRLSLRRYVVDGTSVDATSMHELLSIPFDRGDACCHAGGSLEFDGEGNLFYSIGDNTNPFASDGFAPIDERRGRFQWDAQRSAANSQDLRGKILRIHPEPDGLYSIPEGNLFTDPVEGRPEIYIMGDRNPFRLSVDRRTGYLYWGEVGPDASEDDSLRGPRGYDEINQARTAGNFGWPYTIADNKSYHDYDFRMGRNGSPFDPDNLVNDSPNNTGKRQLPPAQPAFIWYPYAQSREFPVMGGGPRTAQAGPVYYYDDYPDSPIRLPPYYDGKLFVYEWMRDFVAVVTFGEDGGYRHMERFLPGSLEVSNPMDMLFGPDGALYILEYGDVWKRRNMDARLSRVSYSRL